jgi:hypothetical protein
MKKQSYIRRTCRLCGKKNLTNVLHLEASPLPDEYVTAGRIKKAQPRFPLDLMLCKTCGHVQLKVVVYPEIIYQDYLYQTTSSLGLVNHFNQYAYSTISEIRPQKNSLIVDIGSNDGTFLKAFKDKNMRVLGVDPAVDIAKEATNEGIETIPEMFTPNLAKTILGKYGPANIITANNLYANIDNLDELTRGVKILLSSDGVFMIESFYLLDLIKNMVFDFIYHEHLSYFTVKPIKEYFKKHGMKLIDVKHSPTKGGSLRITVQHVNGSRKVSSSVQKMLTFESKFGIHDYNTYKSFGKRIIHAKNMLLRLLKRLKSQGKSIAGYGASATSTTLIYHFKLQKILSFLVDDYNRKQNTYSPGCHIPVVSSSEVLVRRPDYIVILAWRYIEPILEKNKEYLNSGGKFIVPLPKLKVISKK